MNEPGILGTNVPISTETHYELNQGPRYKMLNTFTGTYFPVQNHTDGIYTDQQALLTATGEKLPDGATPTVEEFTRFPLIPFASLAQLVGLVVTPLP